MKMDNQPQVTVDEISGRWGRVLSQFIAQIITLEKQLAAALASCESLAQELERMQKEMTATDGHHHEHVHRLESELAAALASCESLAQELERVQKEVGESENRHHEHVHRLESELELLKGEKSQGAIKVSESEGTNKRLS